MPQFVVFFEDKKFMWDGKIYETQGQADEVKSGYEKAAFETRLITEDSSPVPGTGSPAPGEARSQGKYLVYTRRMAVQQAAIQS
ncbi:MAG: hypothetical protein HY747_12655 [Elusimicrobia bacterium]|nr:hypothetical protein [Elusimicrobiota bacterium]